MRSLVSGLAIGALASLGGCTPPSYVKVGVARDGGYLLDGKPAPQWRIDWEMWRGAPGKTVVLLTCMDCTKTQPPDPIMLPRMQHLVAGIENKHLPMVMLADTDYERAMQMFPAAGFETAP